MTDPPYGEQVRSWNSIFFDLAPSEDTYGEARPVPEDAADLHHLRGLATSQASETEAVLAHLFRKLDLGEPGSRTAGALLRAVKGAWPANEDPQVQLDFDLLLRAVNRRNRLVHDDIQIGYSELGPGNHVPVVAVLGAMPVDSSDLRADLAEQQAATTIAVQMLLRLFADEYQRFVSGSDVDPSSLSETGAHSDRPKPE